MIKNMGLAWITASDAKKTKEFFTKILGLTVFSAAEEYGWYELKAKDGEMTLGIAQENPHENHAPGSNAVLTLSVDDIMVAKKVLEDNQVKILGDVMEAPGHVKLLMFTDADGNKFQLVEELDRQS